MLYNQLPTSGFRCCLWMIRMRRMKTLYWEAILMKWNLPEVFSRLWMSGEQEAHMAPGKIMNSNTMFKLLNQVICIFYSERAQWHAIWHTHTTVLYPVHAYLAHIICHLLLLKIWAIHDTALFSIFNVCFLIMHKREVSWKTDECKSTNEPVCIIFLCSGHYKAVVILSHILYPINRVSLMCLIF